MHLSPLRGSPRARRYPLLASASLAGLLLLSPAGASAAPLSPELSDDGPRLHLGMWTAHVRNLDGGLDSNGLIGVSGAGFFGGTFVNSYGRRSIAAGIQRTLVDASTGGPLRPSLGVRVGFVTGYDERLMALAGITPVLPMAQLVAGVDHSRFGAEVGYTGLAMSLSLSARL